jgi:hypothetical protein
VLIVGYARAICCCRVGERSTSRSSPWLNTYSSFHEKLAAGRLPHSDAFLLQGRQLCLCWCQCWRWHATEQ